MTNETLARLRAKVSESPVLRADSLPTSEEVDDASRELGVPFVQDYREFLLLFGGAMVSPYPIFGLRPVEVMDEENWSVVNVTKRHRIDGIPRSEGWVVISEDHSGNPIGMDSAGAIWIYDHDFGGAAQLARNFEEYIRRQCLNLDVDA